MVVAVVGDGSAVAEKRMAMVIPTACQLSIQDEWEAEQLLYFNTSRLFSGSLENPPLQISDGKV